MPGYVLYAEAKTIESAYENDTCTRTTMTYWKIITTNNQITAINWHTDTIWQYFTLILHLELKDRKRIYNFMTCNSERI